MWGPLRQVSSHTIWGPPQVSFLAYYRGPPQISFFAYHMGAPSDQFLRILYGGPLKPVSSHTIWGPPSDQFLRLLNGGPFGQFLHLLNGAPLIFFLKFYALNYSWGGPIFLNFQGGASAPSCPPLRAPMTILYDDFILCNHCACAVNKLTGYLNLVVILFVHAMWLYNRYRLCYCII